MHSAFWLEARLGAFACMRLNMPAFTHPGFFCASARLGAFDCMGLKSFVRGSPGSQQASKLSEAFGETKTLNFHLFYKESVIWIKNMLPKPLVLQLVKKLSPA